MTKLLNLILLLLITSPVIALSGGTTAAVIDLTLGDDQTFERPNPSAYSTNVTVYNYGPDGSFVLAIKDLATGKIIGGIPIQGGSPSSPSTNGPIGVPAGTKVCIIDVDGVSGTPGDSDSDGTFMSIVIG